MQVAGYRERFPSVSPEFDTVRLFFPSCDSNDEPVWDARSFFDHEFVKTVSSFEVEHDENFKPVLDENGKPKINLLWEKKRLDQSFSSWSKIQVIEGTFNHRVEKWKSRDCKGFDRHEVGVVVEFSVAKFYNFTNGVNRGVPLRSYELVEPALQALDRLGIDKYSCWEKDVFFAWLKNNVVLRRLDLSYNFKVNDKDSTFRALAQTIIRKQKAHLLDEGKGQTVTLGGGRGSYFKVNFYDKYLELKGLFNNRFQSNTDKEYELKRDFWKKNKFLFENVVRFEIQYNSKFFLSNVDGYNNLRGMDMLDNVIMLCKFHWADYLRRCDEQLNTLNLHDDEEFVLIERAINHLEMLSELGEIHVMTMTSLREFLLSCHKNGWQKTRDIIGKTNFSPKRKRVLELTGFDVKRECVEALPIMRIMKSDGFNYRMEQNVRFFEGEVRNFVLTDFGGLKESYAS